jgi:hypothetical protein
MESGGAIGGHPPVPPVCMDAYRMLRVYFTQFTYINLAFSPAPDDTIANLYRVSTITYASRRAETNT